MAGHCSGCRAALTPGRRSGYCRECDREYWRSRPAQPCTACGEMMPKGRRKTRCVSCEREQRRRYYHRYGRLCTGCGGVVPHGYQNTKCPACRSLYAREYWLARGGGQKEKRSREIRQATILLVRQGYSLKQAARLLGCSDTSFYRWGKQYPGWKQAVEAARAYARQQGARP